MCVRHKSGQEQTKTRPIPTVEAHILPFWMDRACYFCLYIMALGSFREWGGFGLLFSIGEAGMRPGPLGLGQEAR